MKITLKNITNATGVHLLCTFFIISISMGILCPIFDYIIFGILKNH